MKKPLNRIKTFLLRFAYFKNLREKRGGSNIDLFDGMDKRLLDRNEKIILDWPSKYKKPIIGLVKDHFNEKKIPYTAYWPKFERFLSNNDLEFNFYNIHASDWIEKSKEYDLIIWRVNSDPISMDEAREKIEFLEKQLKKDCFPSFEEIWSNEDKVKTYHLLNNAKIPIPKTYVSYDPDETATYIENTSFPFVSKIRTGSGSKGVKLIRSKTEARKLAERVFRNGSPTYWPYMKQAGYVYFQEFIKDSEYDLRVIVLGDIFFGYYRYPKKGDFRASGAGNVVKGSIPKEALELARITNEVLQRRIVAIDMVHDKNRGFLVIAVSSFFRVDDGVELEIDGVPGYYVKKGNDYVFKKGRYWVQELALKNVMIELINKKKKFYN